MWDASFWDTTWNKYYGRYNRHHQEIWKASEPYLKGKIVDLGCGPCVLYKDKNVDLTGVDWSQGALREAKKNYPCGLYVQADVRETGLPTEQFDTVLMFGLLDYFDDWEDVLREARRIKKKDGKIFATLLHGFKEHNWKDYPHITGNWHLYTE